MVLVQVKRVGKKWTCNKAGFELNKDIASERSKQLMPLARWMWFSRGEKRRGWVNLKLVIYKSLHLQGSDLTGSLALPLSLQFSSQLALKGLLSHRAHSVRSSNPETCTAHIWKQNETLQRTSPESLISNRQATFIPSALPGGLPLLWCYLQLACFSRPHCTLPSQQKTQYHPLRWARQQGSTWQSF